MSPAFAGSVLILHSLPTACAVGYRYGVGFADSHTDSPTPTEIRRLQQKRVKHFSLPPRDPNLLRRVADSARLFHAAIRDVALDDLIAKQREHSPT